MVKFHLRNNQPVKYGKLPW